ncbi:MAG: ATP-dependent helicase HrpB [Proteobacteria bacterium]|nr:ATP-dependent helicase HrpB [Pseudomonadota bacterium]
MGFLMISLPIDSLLPKLLGTLQVKKNIILKASPGSGKTTRVPRALLESSLLNPGEEIWVLEPRRVAAKYSALRVAEELGDEIGNRVGYQFRFENKTSRETRLKFLTEGMFSRLLLSNPSLEGVGAIILDEFHERHLHTDTALSLVNCLQRTTRPDLRILVMSATIDTSLVGQFLHDSVVLELESKPFPLAIEYRDSPSEKPLEMKIKEALRNHPKLTSPGDVLIFLPGKKEIRKTLETLQVLPQLKDFLILPLHGELTKEEQDLAIRPQKKRKIVLSTNLSETSLTIEGVNFVIDSGLERQAAFSWWTGLPSLNTRKISRASAEQRAGRAARTGPGTCLRVYSQADFESRPAFTTPEIMRSDLSQVLLEMKSIGLTELPEFTWFESPPEDSLKAAGDLLHGLGATDSIKSGLTPLGKQMSKIPAPPRISKLLLEAESLECFESALRLSALISEQALTELDALECLPKSPSFSLKRTQELLRKHFQDSPEKKPENLPLAVLRAFPDRVAKTRKERSQQRSQSHQLELVLASGGTALVPMTAFSLAHDFFIVLDVQETTFSQSSNSKVHARSLLAIEETQLLDLPATLLKDSEELFWDENKKRLLSKSLLRLGNLILEERESVPEKTLKSFETFFKAATGKKIESLNKWADWIEALSAFSPKEQIETQLSRNLLVAKRLGLPEVLPSQLGEKLSQWTWNDFSLASFKDVDWEEILGQCFLAEKSHLLKAMTPVQFSLPSGRKATIHYPMNRNPWMESRLQDFFGLTETPTVLEKTLPLTLHLLAPNQRAIQVTQDLKSFWKNQYPEVKKELSRRYPKHAWPDDTSKPWIPKPRPKGP